MRKRYTDRSSFRIETDALLRIYDNGGHPNVAGLRDMYEDNSNFYMVMDLVSGGEMFEHLIRVRWCKCLTEVNWFQTGWTCT